MKLQNPSDLDYIYRILLGDWAVSPHESEIDPRELLGQEEVSFEEGVEELSHLLKKSIEEQESRHEKVGLLLSGGLDSSTIAALSKSKPVSIVFKDDPANGRGPLDDLVSHLGLDVDIIEFEDIEKCLYLKSHPEFKEIYYSPSLYFYTPMMKKLKDQGIRHVMTGLGGDDIFTPDSNYMFELLRRGKGIDLFRELQCFDQVYDGSLLFAFTHSLLKPVVPRVLKRSLQSWPKWMNLQNWPGRSRYKSPRKRRAEMNLPFRNIVQKSLYWTIFEWGGLQFGMQMEQKMARQMGMSIGHPIMISEIIKLAFRLPLESFVWRGQDKRILREVARTILPPSVWAHKSQQNYAPLFGRILERQTGEIQEQLLSGQLVAQGVIFKEGLERLLRPSEIRHNWDTILRILYCEQLIRG